MGTHRTWLLLFAGLLSRSATGTSSPGPYSAPSPTVGGGIIGGEVAEPGSTPWLVSLRDIDADPPLHFCGGTILSNIWILTTASCVMGYNSKGFEIVLGEYDSSIDEGYEISRDPIWIIPHPKYDYFGYMEYDVALILVPFFFYAERIQPAKLLPPLHCPTHILQQQLSPECSKLCHPSKTKWDLEGEDGLIAGWGEMEHTELSTLVRETNLTILSNEICKDAYPGFEMESLMCASNITYGGAGACVGDSGGGLINKDGYILGVYTYNPPCVSDEFPGVYVNISVVQDWFCSFIHLQPLQLSNRLGLEI